jgi:Na+-transporting methylmalonyl-CoA/oxaloacetate decarboxylase beta subunit
MSKGLVWKGFVITSLLWILVYLVVGFLVMYFGWDKTIHPLIWLPISAVVVFVIAIPYLRYIDKKSQ